MSVPVGTLSKSLPAETFVILIGLIRLQRKFDHIAAKNRIIYLQLYHFSIGVSPLLRSVPVHCLRMKVNSSAGVSFCLPRG